ncbi:MAG: rhodanese-like domain-containing protein [Actinomycetota bacterium]|nr:rhodanese-like domain-containing protein [Actinomycetota bacterium]
MVTSITRDEVKAKIDAGDVVVLEALPAMYYEDAHLPGALNMPHDQVDALAHELVPDKGADIIVYCSNGPCPNSTIASKRLVELGYSNVHEYELGKQDWIEAGLPVEQGGRSQRATS